MEQFEASWRINTSHAPICSKFSMPFFIAFDSQLYGESSRPPLYTVYQSQHLPKQHKRTSCTAVMLGKTGKRDKANLEFGSAHFLPRFLQTGPFVRIIYITYNFNSTLAANIVCIFWRFLFRQKICYIDIEISNACIFQYFWYLSAKTISVAIVSRKELGLFKYNMFPFNKPILYVILSPQKADYRSLDNVLVLFLAVSNPGFFWRINWGRALENSQIHFIG